MEAYLLDWLTLIARWAHIVVGIAWIGASFYFIWLDNHLEAAKDPAFAGELYAIHGGGFYRAQKYRLAPDALPSTLHWFKWEAYWTWLTGFVLLVLVYYLNAELYLIDPAGHEAIAGRGDRHRPRQPGSRARSSMKACAALPWENVDSRSRCSSFSDPLPGA